MVKSVTVRSLSGVHKETVFWGKSNYCLHKCGKPLEAAEAEILHGIAADGSMLVVPWKGAAVPTVVRSKLSLYRMQIWQSEMKYAREVYWTELLGAQDSDVDLSVRKSGLDHSGSQLHRRENGNA